MAHEQKATTAGHGEVGPKSSTPPCTYSSPPHSLTPCEALGDGRSPCVDAERWDQVREARSRAYRSSKGGTPAVRDTGISLSRDEGINLASLTAQGGPAHTGTKPHLVTPPRCRIPLDYRFVCIELGAGLGGHLWGR
jgi:hypothetical protein